MISSPELQEPAHSEVVKTGKEKKVTKIQGIIGTGVVVQPVIPALRRLRQNYHEFKLAWAIE